MNKEQWNMVISDETGDYYVIPVDKYEEWREFLEEPAEVPSWAKYVGGFPDCIRFTTWKEH